MLTQDFGAIEDFGAIWLRANQFPSHVSPEAMGFESFLVGESFGTVRTHKSFFVVIKLVMIIH